MFRTKYTEHKRVFSNPGDPIKIEYGSKIDKNFNVIVEPKGKFSLYEYIQSFKDSCDINILIKRFQAGDDKALLKKAAHYIDITEVPKNIHEYMQFAEDTKKLFNSLPAEIKENFNNNILEFMADFESKGINDKLITKEMKQKLAEKEKHDLENMVIEKQELNEVKENIVNE